MRSADFPRVDFLAGQDAKDLERLVPFVDEMRGCIQDAVHHAEGDVWRHTVMTCRALAESDGFAARPSEVRQALSWAALLHDVAKPATRTVAFDDVLGRERVSHPNHAAKGARTAWAHLWDLGAPLELRRAVHGLILNHQRIFHVFSEPDWEDRIARISLQVRWRDLAILAMADNRGRICSNQRETEEVLALAHMAAEEMGCLDAPMWFPSEQARLRFARVRGATRHFDPPPPKGSTVTVLSGMPGVGKSTYAATALEGVPEVSFDAVRAMGIKPGTAEQVAFEQARVHLRRGSDFVWNATCLTRLDRDRIVDLAVAYDARVEIHCLDAPRAVVEARNRDREAVVPREAMERFTRRWDPVLDGEAHLVRQVDATVPFRRPEPVEEPGSGPSPG